MGITTPEWSLLHLLTAALIGFIAGRNVGTTRGQQAPHEARETRKSAQDSLDGLSPRVRKSVEALLADGRIIEAVRDVRVATGLGLKEAKDVVDLMREIPPSGGARLH